MKLKSIILTLAATMLFASCEKAFMGRDCDNSPVATFDYLWQQIDEKYSMFDVKQTDWQAVYGKYRPQVSDDISDDSLFAICGDMLAELNDGHVNLIRAFGTSHADSLVFRFYTQAGYDINALIQGYLGPHYRSTGGIAHTALCDGRVVYMHYGSFGSSITPAQLRHIIGSYPAAEGIILDIRGNGGGTMSNITNILRTIAHEGRPLLYRSQIKNGRGHNDFTPLADTYAPAADSGAYDGPWVVLTDRGCFSSASVFALCSKAYPTMTLMGDTTGGGMGLPHTTVLPNGWRAHFSITRSLAPDGSNYENGVPPDIRLPFDRAAAFAQNKDNIIDSACHLILAGGRFH